MTRGEVLKIAKPMLFNTQMVRAIEYGIKRETRRVINKAAVTNVLSSTIRKAMPDVSDKRFIRCLVDMPYEVGGIIYVRETWNWHPIESGGKKSYIYRADFDNEYAKNVIWRPSIHMPKAAARIFLKVKDIRVERLQEIDINGIKNEGVASMAVHAGDES